MKAHNDNEELSFITLGAATANVVRYLEKQNPENEAEEAPNREIDKQREHQRFVETRLREIERFERGLRSGQRARRKWRD